jgi:hypothetical protein
MIFNFKKPPVFKFYSHIPGVKEQYPIIPAKNHRPSWIKSVLEAYKNKTSKLSNHGPQFVGTGKCPGIIELGKIGWTVTTWFDVIITTSGRRNCAWKIPSTLPPSLPGYSQEPIKFIDMSADENKIPIPDYSSQLLIKMYMPWHVEIPKGWNLLMLPVNYSDDTRFQCSSGILKPGSYVEVNPQIFWNVTQGEELIVAGTPLCHLIPIPDESYNATAELLEITEEQIKNRQSFYYRKGCTFARNPNVL